MKGTNIKLGGKERVLRYDLNAVAEIGDRLGLTVRIAHMGEDLLGTPLPLSALRTVVWAGLLHAEPELTEREVGAWVDEENWNEVFQVFFSRFAGTSSDTQDKIKAAFGQTDSSENATTLVETASTGV